jgi:hypothetical protein
VSRASAPVIRAPSTGHPGTADRSSVRVSRPAGRRVFEALVLTVTPALIHRDVRIADDFTAFVQRAARATRR